MTSIQLPYKCMTAAVIIAICSFSFALAQDFIILPNGHSHNDYTRDRPLFDALEHGFTSIEVDVFLHKGRMIVTHDEDLLDQKPSIQELYLDPLKKIIKDNGGTVFQNDNTKLVLMVDLKSERVSTYLALREIFDDYLDIIERYDGEDKIHGPVQVLLSGGPPLELIEKESSRYFYVDGSVDQWSMDYPVELMPRASTNYRSFFKWHGKGEMPTEEEAKLRELIKKAHAAGRKVRFWGCPNSAVVWKKLLDEGADWINVDDLQGYNEFYKIYMENR